MAATRATSRTDDRVTGTDARGVDAEGVDATGIDATGIATGIDATVVARLVAQLASARSADGGWGSAVDRASDAESTAWVLLGASRLATMVPALTPFREDARRWLLSAQQADGSWLYRSGPSISTWPTAPAIWALAADRATVAPTGDAEERQAPSQSASDRAIRWLVSEHSVTPNWWQRLLRRFASASTAPSSAPSSAQAAEPPVVLDASLDGFGWAQSTFAWVEPTAIAMIALSTATSDDANARLAIGARLLIDRQSPDGGWNYGNKRVLGVDLPGYPDTTAWALLGLSVAIRANAYASLDAVTPIARGFDALSRGEAAFESPLAVALAMLAHHAYQRHEATQVADAAARLQKALLVALDAVQDGYPMLDTRTVVLSLLALFDVSLVAATAA